MKPRELYRVIGLRADGMRDVRASNLGKETAEAVQALAQKSGLFVRVMIEKQAREEGKPPSS